MSISTFEGQWTQSSAQFGFTDPYADAASRSMPDSSKLALRWSEFIVYNQGLLYRALLRVVSYFITDVEIIGDVGEDEKIAYKDFLTDELHLPLLLRLIGTDLVVYDNSFTSILQKFRRYFGCPKCGAQFPLKEIAKDKRFKFKWSNYEVRATCPSCDYSGDWGEPIDVLRDEVCIRRWNPHDLDIRCDQYYSGAKEYIWRIPAEYRRQISRGELMSIEEADWKVVQAIKQGKDFQFDPENFFHLSTDNLAGIRSGGWGISDVIACFRQAWRTAVAERSQEAFFVDHMVPMRVVTPKGIQGEDPLQSYSMGNFVSRIQTALRTHQRDPNAWFVFPFPVEYQMFGADAKQLAPKELLDQAYELLLSAAGVPMELFKGSLQFQVVPAALRLFESMWTHIPQALNCFLAFLARRLSRCLAWEKVKIRLTRVTMIDDLQKAQERLQLGVGGAISQTDALKAVGLDYREQLRKQMEEAKFKAELDAKMQEEMQGKDMARQMALGGPPGGAPGQQSIVQGQGQSVGQDPSAAQQGGFSQAGMIESMMGGLGASGSYRLPDMVGVAGQLATQLLSMPESARQSQLIQLRNRNEAVWALVRAQIDKITNRMRTQGKNQLMAQQFGGT